MRQGKYKYIAGRFVHVEDMPSPWVWAYLPMAVVFCIVIYNYFYQ